MFRGQRLDGPAVQPSVEFDRAKLAVGVWASTPLASKVSGQSDPEIDPYGSYTIVLNDALSLQPGATAYLFPRAHPANGFYRATFEPNFAVNYTIHGVTFTPKIYYDLVLRGPTYELNAAYALPLRNIGSEVDLFATIGAYNWDDAVARAQPRTSSRGNYGSVNATVPFQIGTKSKISGSVGYFAGWDGTLRPAGSMSQANALVARRIVVALGYSVTF
jgi:hypothetical protein